MRRLAMHFLIVLAFVVVSELGAGSSIWGQVPYCCTYQACYCERQSVDTKCVGCAGSCGYGTVGVRNHLCYECGRVYSAYEFVGSCCSCPFYNVKRFSAPGFTGE